MLNCKILPILSDFDITGAEYNSEYEYSLVVSYNPEILIKHFFDENVLLDNRINSIGAMRYLENEILAEACCVSTLFSNNIIMQLRAVECLGEISNKRTMKIIKKISQSKTLHSRVIALARDIIYQKMF